MTPLGGGAGARAAGALMTGAAGGVGASVTSNDWSRSGTTFNDTLR